MMKYSAAMVPMQAPTAPRRPMSRRFSPRLSPAAPIVEAMYTPSRPRGMRYWVRTTLDQAEATTVRARSRMMRPLPAKAGPKRTTAASSATTTRPTPIDAPSMRARFIDSRIVRR